MNYLTLSIFVSFLTVMSMSCGGGLELTSQWRDRDVTIDGRHEEWQGGMSFIEKENVSVGFFNDQDFLYVSMTTTNREIRRQFMAMGFTLWFDPNGGREKEFGIKFPVGMFEMGMMMRGRGRSEDIESLRENFEKSLLDLEIIMPGEEEPRRMPIAEATGIEVKIGDPKEELVYEIKVPLHKSETYPYAIAAKVEKPVGVGFETSQIDREKMREQMGSGGIGGGRPGGFGGGKGGFGGGRGGMMGGRPQMPEQFKLWATVQLGSEDSPSSAQPMTEL